MSGIPENIRLYEGGGQISTDWLITTEDSCRLITDSKTPPRWMDWFVWIKDVWKLIKVRENTILNIAVFYLFYNKL